MGLGNRIGLVLLSALLCTITRAQPPATKPAVGPDYALTATRVQEIKGADSYLYGEAETTLADIQQTVGQLLEPLLAAAEEGKARMTGPVVFVYTGATGDMNTPFKLQIGAPVKAATQPWGDYKVRKLDALRAATLVYSGALAGIGQAYQQVFADLFEAGLTPTGESREMYLYWEGPESPNNVVLIQIGVK